MATTLFAIWIAGVILVLAAGVCWSWLEEMEYGPLREDVLVLVLMALLWPYILVFFSLLFGGMRICGKIEEVMARRRFARGEW